MRIQDVTMIFVGAASVINSISIIILAASLKKQSKALKEVKGKAIDVFFDVEKYKTFAKQCFKNFCYAKDSFDKVRDELIKQKILTQDFKYLDEDEAMEKFINKFIKK